MQVLSLQIAIQHFVFVFFFIIFTLQAHLSFVYFHLFLLEKQKVIQVEVVSKEIAPCKVSSNFVSLSIILGKIEARLLKLVK